MKAKTKLFGKLIRFILHLILLFQELETCFNLKYEKKSVQDSTLSSP